MYCLSALQLTEQLVVRVLLCDATCKSIQYACNRYDTGDGTVARADGWRLLLTLGEEDHTPEDFERLLLPTPSSASVGRLSGGATMLRRSVSNAAAQAGVTAANESTAGDLDNAGQTLRDPFKVRCTVVKLCDLAYRTQPCHTLCQCAIRQ